MTDSQEDYRKQAVRLARAMMLISITLVTIPVPIAWWFGGVWWFLGSLVVALCVTVVAGLTYRARVEQLASADLGESGGPALIEAEMRRAILNTAAVGLVLGCVALGGVALLGIRSARADEGLVTTRVLVALAGVGIIALVIGLLFLWSVRRSRGS